MMSWTGKVPVVGAGAVSAAGAGRGAIVDALLERRDLLAPSWQLAASHPAVRGAEVPDAATNLNSTPVRSRDRVSRAAMLAAIATRRTLTEAAWAERREEIGFFLGVGASGGAVQDVEAILAVSVEDGCLSLGRLGARGLAVCNPLFTFPTMHNFTLCHSAMLEGTGGPNAAFYSRGGGTLFALGEALQALTDGACTCTLAGGADTALHPVTWAELSREGFAARGLVPGEGAAVLALGSGRAPLAVLEHQGVNAPPVQTGASPSHVVLAPWGAPARDRLAARARLWCEGAVVFDLGACLGECLAAQPALGWVAAVELIARGIASRVLVLSEGVDGDTGSVMLGAPA